jgi:hypothetical protein
VTTDCLDRIDHRSLLPNEQMPGAMEHQAALLLRRLGRHKPHIGPGHCFTDGLSISGIILVSLYVRLDIGWRHQAHGMPKRLEFPCPMVRRGAGLDPHETPGQLLEESNDVSAIELAPDDHIAFSINAMNLKNRLCDIETDCRNRLHGPVLRIGSPHGDHGTYVPVEEPSTASKADKVAAASDAHGLATRSLH